MVAWIALALALLELLLLVAVAVAARVVWEMVQPTVQPLLAMFSPPASAAGSSSPGKPRPPAASSSPEPACAYCGDVAVLARGSVGGYDAWVCVDRTACLGRRGL